MIGLCPAAYALEVMGMKSRFARAIDLCTGYLGLFLIGLIGWYCDRFGSSKAHGRPARCIDSGVRQVGRFVD
jgi:hypothetical protein